MRVSSLSLACAGALLVTAACTRSSSDANSAAVDTTASGAAMTPETTTPAMSSTAEATATAVVRDAANRELGTLTLTETATGITADGRLTGLPPGEHAIHFHTVGKCEAPFTSAGGHWNPTNRQHGSQNPQGSHFGDLPNITVGADSSVTVHVSSPGGTLRGANPLLDADGGAVVVHAKADDYKTDPAGNAGDRIACGVVTGS